MKTAIVVAHAADETDRPEKPDINQNKPLKAVTRQTHSKGFFAKKKTKL